jgi:hypothetical protein
MGASATASCKIISFPLSAATSTESQDTVCWSDDPHRVLARLREITGRREWWR